VFSIASKRGGGISRPPWANLAADFGRANSHARSLFISVLQRMIISSMLLGVQISSVRSKMHLFQNKMNEQIN